MTIDPPELELDTYATQRLQVLRDTAPQVHADLMQGLPDLPARFAVAGAVAALADLLTRTATEAPDCALALVGRLGGLDADVDVVALRRWAFFGLQQYHDNARDRLRHFEAGDPRAFAAVEWGHGDGSFMVVQCNMLAHYFAGFGFPHMRVETHPPAPIHGPPQRPAVGDDLLVLPRRLDGVPAFQRTALYRAAGAHAIAHLKFSRRGRPAGNRQPMLLAMMALIEDARVERLMMEEYPGLRQLWGRFHVATQATAGFEFAGLAARLARALHDPAYADSNSWVNKGRAMFEGARDLADFDRVARLLAIDVEKMRLRFSTRLYRVEPAYRDDNTLLWNFDQSLPEDSGTTQTRDHFELKSDDLPPPPRNLRLVEVDTRKRTRYPEWDCKVEMLHENWTTVIDEVPALPESAGRRGALPHHRPTGLGGRARIPDRALRLTRLEEGDELDLNAAVDSVIQRRARRAPDPRIFRRHGHRRGSASVVLLMDLSESTGRFIPGSFVTVLDAEKRAALMVADAIDPARDRLAVHGFSSDGRGHVHYLHVKDFDQPLGREQKARLSTVKSGLSTRMGAALRHAAASLAREETERKLILLLTDGEPSDIDVDEDDYLREDTRHAVVAAAAMGIRTFCLTLDRRADPYVRRIFGERNYMIDDRTDAFTRNAGRALVKLISQ